MRMLALNQELRRASRVPREGQREKGTTLRWFMLAGVYVVTVLLTSPFLLYRPPSPGAGEMLESAPLRAWTDFRFTSQEALEAWSQERQREYKRIYVYRPEIKTRVLDDLENLFGAVSTLDPRHDSPEQISEIIQRMDTRLSARLGVLDGDEAGTFVSVVSDPRFQRALTSIVNDAYDNHVVMVQEQVTRFKGAMQDRVVEIVDDQRALVNRRYILDSPLPIIDWYSWNPLLGRLAQALPRDEMALEARRVAERLLGAVLQPNLEFDELLSRRSFEEYPRRDLSTLYPAGEVLVSSAVARRPLSEETSLLLRAHHQAVVRQHLLRLAGHAAFVLLVLLILIFHLLRFSRHFQFSPYYTALIALPVLIGLAAEAAMIVLADGDTDRVGYLFPAGAIGMLGVLLLDMRMAIMLVTWGCLLLGLQTDLRYDFVIVGLFGGYTAVAALAAIRKRWELFLASFYVGVVNALVILITGYIRTPEAIPFDLASLGFIAGIASFLILAVLPLFERFGIITDIQLLELTGLQHPLLRQVEEQAPGTWQHTLNVAKLAEAAATKIGVNYLIIRAGVYFHDIGKVKKPEYFTENQITNEDKMRHDSLKPIMSARVIMNHVKEGVEMARAARLPERLIDFIVQHHGTSVITYFYNKALAAQERGELKETVRIEDYRYPGVKPQTIEAAIVMLADSVEATATARLTGRMVREDDIQQVVRNTILEKFNDGQFDECNLTLRDLNTIRETFVDVLKSRFHTRIDYPKKGGGAGAKEKPRSEKPRVGKEKDGRGSASSGAVETRGGKGRSGSESRAAIPQPSSSAGEE